MMMLTFFRKRIPIAPLSDKCKGRFDLMILAGPTWSYHPSGPVLSLLDRNDSTLFANQTVISLISCRGYWRMHWFGLRALLKKTAGRGLPLRLNARPSPDQRKESCRPQFPDTAGHHQRRQLKFNTLLRLYPGGIRMLDHPHL